MEDLKAELRGHATYAYMPAAVRKACDEAADRIEALEALLGECRLQLEYLDERSPSGTTPAVIARIDALLREGGE